MSETQAPPGHQLEVQPSAEDQHRIAVSGTQETEELARLKQKVEHVQRELALIQHGFLHFLGDVRQTHLNQSLRVDEVLHQTGPPHKSPFFSLPREIRDLIYDAALGEYSFTFGDGVHDIQIVASNVADGSALAVNKQFHAEYYERAQALSTLTVSDVKYCDVSVTHIRLPSAASRVMSIHFNLAALIKHPMLAHEEFDQPYHGSLVKKILELIPCHRSLSIRVEVPWSHSIAHVYGVLQSTPWKALPKLKSLKAYQTFKFKANTSGIKHALFEYGPPRNLLMEWSAETGKVDWVDGGKSRGEESVQTDADTSDEGL